MLSVDTVNLHSVSMSTRADSHPGGNRPLINIYFQNQHTNWPSQWLSLLLVLLWTAFFVYRKIYQKRSIHSGWPQRSPLHLQNVASKNLHFTSNRKFLLLFLIAPVLSLDDSAAFTPAHLGELKNATVELFQHAWLLYRKYGFPADEVRPLTCEPYGPNWDDMDDGRNDAMGNVLLTLIDNLDSFVLLQQWDELEWALSYLEDHQTIFEQNTTVQVFEASIRWLGGLLLTHLLLTDVTAENERFREIQEKYNGFLLVLAYDLGLRLLPAYKTKHSLPMPRINLKYGLAAVPERLQAETCTSGATTPFVEFLLLLRLTGDSQFEVSTLATFWKLWNLRLPLGLLPMLIDPHNNEWLDQISGIGASVDSFYEYALKGAILFDLQPLWLVFERLYAALLSHLAQLRGENGPTLFQNVDATKGTTVLTWIDSLGAFWAGVQVLAGQLSDAVLSHVMYMKMWDFFDSVPERWAFLSPLSPDDTIKNKVKNAINLEWYPLRPEFIELTYYLFRATRDPMYLQIGLRILRVFQDRFVAPCGFAGIQDIRTGKFQNRMETFVLGESLKYLYLLFDAANELVVHRLSGKNWVFLTEAHPLWYLRKYAEESAAKFNVTLHSLKLHVSLMGPSQRSFFGGLYAKWARLAYQMAAEAPETLPKAEVYPNNTRPWTHLHSCELKPKQLKISGKLFLHSGYYAWRQLFFPEAKFPNTLARPDYLKRYNSRTPHHYIELTKPFFETFSLFDQKLKCPRFPTSVETEYVIDSLRRPEELPMYVFERNTGNFSKNDILMTELAGQLKFEVLTIGDIDTTNTRISREYIRRVRPDTWVSGKSIVLRIDKINGAFIGRHRKVWIPRKTVTEGDFYRISHDGRVYIQGQYIENLRVF